MNDVNLDFEQTATTDRYLTGERFAALRGKLSKAFGVAEEEAIAFIDVSADRDGSDGILFGNTSVRFIVAVKDRLNTASGEKLQATLPNEKFANALYVIQDGSQGGKVTIELADPEIAVGSWISIQMVCPGLTAEDASTIGQVIDLAQKAYRESAGLTDPTNISKGLDAELVNAYLNASIADPYVLKYRKAFANYRVGAIDRFAVSWSWAGFFFGWLYLMHRRAYLFMLASLGVSLFINIVLPGVGWIVASVASGILNNYLIYRQFLKSLRTVQMATSDRNEQIKGLKALGGMNSFTATVMTIWAVLIIVACIIGFIVVFFRTFF